MASSLENGLSKQILSVAIVEPDAKGRWNSFFFEQVQNFELVIKLTKKATLNTTETYFKQLQDQIANQGLETINFSAFNTFFRSDEALGFDVTQMNKRFSGDFNYMLDLPVQQRPFERLNMLNL